MEELTSKQKSCGCNSMDCHRAPNCDWKKTQQWRCGQGDNRCACYNPENCAYIKLIEAFKAI